jgi:hypothetical protein
MARFHQPDHAKGDANTLGGYMAVHDRPAAFEGSDGFSYSVEIVTDRTADTAAPFAAYLLFVRWARIGAQSPEGHLETNYLTSGATEDRARAALGEWKLEAVRAALEELILAQHGSAPRRKWWDAMRHEGGGEGEDLE